MMEHVKKDITFDEYEAFAKSTAFYPHEMKIIYPALGLAGETGEVCEKIKKVLRDENGKFTDRTRAEIVRELGDVLWYITAICHDMGIPLRIVAALNIEKLKSRAQRDALGGSGDNR